MANSLRYQFVVTDNGNIVVQGSKNMIEELKKRVGQKGMLIYSFEEKSVIGLAQHYEKDLIPQFKQSLIEQGTYLVEKAIHRKLWAMSSVTNELVHTSPYKLTHQEAIFFIAELRQIAAEHFNFYLKTYTEL